MAKQQQQAEGQSQQGSQKPKNVDQTFRRGKGPEKKVFASVCPTSENHRRTRVYKTSDVRTTKDEDGKLVEFQRRYCVCDDCGETWWQDGPPASE